MFYTVKEPLFPAKGVCKFSLSLLGTGKLLNPFVKVAGKYESPLLFFLIYVVTRVCFLEFGKKHLVLLGQSLLLSIIIEVL